MTQIIHSDPLVIAGKTFSSRLIVGTGKYASHEVMQQAHKASGADLVTVAVRRVNVTDRSQESLLVLSTRINSRCCLIRLAVTQPRTPFGQLAWPAKSDYQNG